MAKVKAARVKGKKFTFDDLELILLSLPTVIWYLVFSFLPLFGLLIAFKSWHLSGGFFETFFSSEWIGFTNFEFLFATSTAMESLRNTILYNVLFVILGVVIPVTLAIMISNLYSQKLGKVCQTAMFLPHFMSWVVASYFLFAFLSGDKGLVNNMIEAMGGTAINWYGEEAVGWWPFIIVLMNIWKTTGYGMVVYLASITGIDATYYEAAVIDGATKWQQVTRITIPLLKQIMVIMAIMAVGKIFNTDIGLFQQVPKSTSQLYPVTQTLDVYIYNALRTMNNIGMSSAAAFFQSVAGCITILIANLIVSKIDEESAFF